MLSEPRASRRRFKEAGRGDRKTPQPVMNERAPQVALPSGRMAEGGNGEVRREESAGNPVGGNGTLSWKLTAFGRSL